MRETPTTQIPLASLVSAVFLTGNLSAPAYVSVISAVTVIALASSVAFSNSFFRSLLPY